MQCTNLVENDRPQFIDPLNHLFNTIVILCVPATLLVYTLREPIVLILSGQGYFGVTPLLGIVAFALLMATPNSLMINAILIPMRRKSKVALATILGAVTNIALDSILIPHFGTISACYSILAAGFAVFIVSARYAIDQLRQLHLWSAI